MTSKVDFVINHDYMESFNTIRHSEIVKTFFKDRSTLITLFLLSGVYNILTMLPTVYMLLVFEKVMTSKNTASLAIITAVTICLYASSWLAEYLRTKSLNTLNIEFIDAYKSQIFDSIFYNNFSVGGSSAADASRVQMDFQVVRGYLSGPGILALLDFIWAPVFIVVIWLLHPLLALVAIFIMGSLLLVGLLALGKAKDSSALDLIEQELNTRFLFGKLRNIEVIKAMGMSKRFAATWAAQVSESSASRYGEDLSNAKFYETFKIIRIFGGSFALAVGAVFAIWGEISGIAIIAVSLLIGRVTSPVDMLLGGLKGLANATSSAARLDSYLRKYDNEKLLRGRNRRIIYAQPKNHLHINISNLRYYTNTERVVQKQFEVRLVEGDLLWISGAAGTGKSSILSAIMGLGVLYDGEIVIETTKMGDDPSIIGYVPQVPSVMAGTVADNLSSFLPADPNNRINAAKISGVHDTILSLSKGYNTFITPDSNVLSGGQRQKLAIARSLVGEPSILLLDEPNSSLDSESDLHFASMLSHLRSNGSIIVIVSHKPLSSTLYSHHLALDKPKFD